MGPGRMTESTPDPERPAFSSFESATAFSSQPDMFLARSRLHLHKTLIRYRNAHSGLLSRHYVQPVTPVEKILLDTVKVPMTCP
jgi:hypothetical protein